VKLLANRVSYVHRFHVRHIRRPPALSRWRMHPRRVPRRFAPLWIAKLTFSVSRMLLPNWNRHKHPTSSFVKDANDTVLTSFGLRIARRPRAESRF
jgi:hypothetical protein